MLLYSLESALVRMINTVRFVYPTNTTDNLIRIPKYLTNATKALNKKEAE